MVDFSTRFAREGHTECEKFAVCHRERSNIIITHTICIMWRKLPGYLFTGGKLESCNSRYLDGDKMHVVIAKDIACYAHFYTHKI